MYKRVMALEAKSGGEMSQGLRPIESLNPLDVLTHLHNWQTVPLQTRFAWQFHLHGLRVLTIMRPQERTDFVDEGEFGVLFENHPKRWPPVRNNGQPIRDGNFEVRGLIGYKTDSSSITFTNGKEQMVITGRDHLIQVLREGEVIAVDHVCEEVGEVERYRDYSK